MKRELIFATTNQHKLAELRALLPEYSILSLDEINFAEEIIEDGVTFEENALIKARTVHERTGKTVIADDSGLCVTALLGAPGVFSARYAGEPCNDKKNNEKLILEMYDVETDERTAFFVSAAAVVFEDHSEAVTRGEVSGMIGFEEIGTQGFGYDPLFICDETNLRYAQMSQEQKNMISHRKRAFEQLKPILDSHFN